MERIGEKQRSIERSIAGHTEYLSIVNGSEVHCSVCSTTLKYRDNFSVTHHLQTKTHLKNINPETQKDDHFTQELCEAFLSANIPLSKINNPVLKKFLEKYTKRHVPDESTLRRYRLKAYEKVMVQIKKNIAEHYLWVSVDETVDILGRCVVNVVVGVLHPIIEGNSYLVSTKISDEVNAISICNIVKESLENLLGPEPIQRGKILLLLSDSAAYMLKAGKLLKEIYPNMLHITCVAHALHRICEFVRDQYPTVDKLISTCKKIFRKAPLRVSLYKRQLPSIPLPPSPIITRWGSWIEATSFYCEHFHPLKEFITQLPDDASSIIECKAIFQNHDLYDELQFINNHFKHLTTTIQYFEKRNIKLTDALATLNHAIEPLKTIPGEIGNKLNQKISAVFNRNPDLNILCQLCTTETQNSSTYAKYYSFIPNFNTAPLSSCDVERTFSVFKDVLTSKRVRFTPETLEHTLIVTANSALLLPT